MGSLPGSEPVNLMSALMCTEATLITPTRADPDLMRGSATAVDGQIHAGWAVPTRSAPDHYFTKMNETRAKQRMLWSPSQADGKPGYASALLGKR